MVQLFTSYCYHFCHSLLVKQVTKFSPDPRVAKLDSVCCEGKWQTHITKQYVWKILLWSYFKNAICKMNFDQYMHPCHYPQYLTLSLCHLLFKPYYSPSSSCRPLACNSFAFFKKIHTYEIIQYVYFSVWFSFTQHIFETHAYCCMLLTYYTLFILSPIDECLGVFPLWNYYE